MAAQEKGASMQHDITGLLLACALALSSAAAPAADPYAGLPTEQRKTLAWFDTLGFPDVKGCTFVRVGTGNWSQSGDRPPQNQYLQAFLLRTHTNTFTVLSLDLVTRTFVATGATSEHERVFYEARDLRNAAESRLQHVRNPPAKENAWDRFGEQMSERAEISVLAWGCARNGLIKQAGELISQAEEMTAGRGRSPVDGDPETLVGKLEKDIGHAVMWRDVLAFGDPSVSRRELLARFDDFVSKYPASEHLPRARETANLLRQMVQEDAAHAAAARKPWNQMTRDERIVELIFQLRDQNGHQCSQPGSCDIFEDYRSVTNTPAHQLVAFGYDAVPQLIAALDDSRFTRSVGFHRDFYFSHHVLCVADCAQAILSRIAGRTFYQAQTTSGCMTKDGKAASTRRLVQAWWDGLQKKGERQALIDAVEAGDDNAVHQAQRLQEKFPDALLGALTTGVPRATQSWVRSQLIARAGQIPGDQAVPLLLRELRTAPTLADRVAAATALQTRSHPAALPAMIQEWRNLPEDVPRDDGDGPGTLITFLATCGDTNGIRTLDARLRELPVGQRLEVVEAVGESGGHPHAAWDDATVSTNAAVAAAVEELLACALEDTDERTGMSGSRNGKSYTDPRICDMAGFFLHELWKERYTFDLGASLRTREKQRYACLNQWRAKHGLAAVAPPAARRIAPAPKEQTSPLLDVVRQATTAADAAKALRELESLGLPALPAVREALPGLAANHPARKDLQALARRLSCIVADVVIGEGSVKPDEELAQTLQKLKGRPLTSSRIIDILLQFTQSDREDTAGIKLRSERDDNLSGVVVTVMLPAAKAQRSHPSQQWQTHSQVTAGGESLLGSSGGSSADYQQKREAYADEAEAIDKALRTEPRTPVVVNLSLLRE